MKKFTTCLTRYFSTLGRGIVALAVLGLAMPVVAGEIESLAWERDALRIRVKGTANYKTESLEQGQRLRVTFPDSKPGPALNELTGQGIVKGVYPYPTENGSAVNVDLLLNESGQLEVRRTDYGYRITPVAAALLKTLMGSAVAGSLYNEDRFRAFVADPKAIRVGDNLTVVVTEIASMTTTARTATDKDGSVTGSARGNSVNNQGSLSLAEDFSGGGRIERSGKLVAQVTVAVAEIKPNGDLWVKGEQEIEVNDEKQKLVLEGRVRREDIRSDNTVASSRLSEAKIAFTGQGLLAEKQKPGILTRFLSWLRIL